MDDMERRELQELAQADPTIIGRKRPSPTETVQQALGNNKLIQMRRAIQRHPAELPEWLRDTNAVTPMDAPLVQKAQEQAHQQQLEKEAEKIQIPSGGQALDPAVQTHAETHLGVPMHDVQVVHNGDAACKPIQAQAFTTEESGRPTVVLGNEVNLSSSDGQFTLMHELTHVAQQKKGMAGGLSGMGGDEGDRNHLENHADSVASTILNTPPL